MALNDAPNGGRRGARIPFGANKNSVRLLDFRKSRIHLLPGLPILFALPIDESLLVHARKTSYFSFGKSNRGERTRAVRY